MYVKTTLVRTENDREIKRTTDSEFFYEIQRSVLISLKEDGTLTETQYRYALDTLTEQRRALIRSLVDGGEVT